MRPHSLLAYDADGNITHTLDYRVCYDLDDPRVPIGLYDFAAMEEAGIEMTTLWTAEGAKGSKVWPEWLGVRAHEFMVELDGPPGQKRIVALVHKYSGTRRERRDIERAIKERAAATGQGEPVDLRDIVGGPDRPLVLDDAGATVTPIAASDAPSLPLITVNER